MNTQTEANLHSWEVGEQLLAPLFASEKLRPQRFSTFGDITPKNGFEIECLESCKPHWGTTASTRISGIQREIFEGFNWKRTRVAKSQGAVTFPSDNMKGTRLSGGVFFQAKYNKDVDWLGLFKNTCNVVSAYAGILHVVNELDRPNLIDRAIREPTLEEEIEEAAWSRYSHGSFSCEFRAGELNSLVTGLTNLGWASWFGGELLKEVDEVAISAAGFPIEKFDNGYLIRITEKLDDVTSDFKSFSRKRRELKSLFREDLFLVKNEPKVV